MSLIGCESKLSKPSGEREKAYKPYLRQHRPCPSVAPFVQNRLSRMMKANTRCTLARPRRLDTASLSWSSACSTPACSDGHRCHTNLRNARNPGAIPGDIPCRQPTAETPPSQPPAKVNWGQLGHQAIAQSRSGFQRVYQTETNARHAYGSGRCRAPATYTVGGSGVGCPSGRHSSGRDNAYRWCAAGASNA
eukprot:364840-Chlamydomonas_euryale.AAC.3